MTRQWLVPADGLAVPLEGGGYFPAAGAEVEISSYYRRRLRDGELVPGERPEEFDPALLEAARAVIERGDVTASGAPKLPALEAEYGSPVTTELRDRVFAALAD